MTRDDDDEVRFVLDQHTELDFYSASSLKQQSAGRHVAPLRHIILIPSQPSSFSLMLRAKPRSNKYQLYSLWFDRSTLTIMPPMGLREEEEEIHVATAVDRDNQQLILDKILGLDRLGWLESKLMYIDK